jgi:hypothetical protein
MSAASFWPLIGALAAIAAGPSPLDAVFGTTAATFGLFAALAFLTMADLVAVLTLDIWLALTSESVADKAFWVFALVLGNVVTAPLFYLAHGHRIVRA